MLKHIGVDGLVRCPECDYEDLIKDYKKNKEGDSFKFRCLTCGYAFNLKWEKRNIIFLLMDKDK